ncbi:MAG: GNAT family N-acetyltransferase [Candidatus Portiera sp.]|nr:GNAT family N-acetyltransferase [Portiera sp.]
MSNSYKLGDLGELVKDWQPPPAPSDLTLQGKHCLLTPLNEQHGEALYSAYQLDRENINWRYLPYGPYDSLKDYSAWIKSVSNKSDPLFFAVAKNNLVAPNDWLVSGIASYLRITPTAGTIEVGSINFSPALQGTRAATEAMYLMMKWAFDKGYRRYEWKCNALNHRSRLAAQRLGFSYEGIFRQALVVKERNRDTAWFAVIDKEWHQLRQCFEKYLADDNFDADNQQKVSLSSLTYPLLFKTDTLTT